MYIYRNRRVCHKHFEPHFFYGNNRLTPVAVPTQFLTGMSSFIVLFIMLLAHCLLITFSITIHGHLKYLMTQFQETYVIEYASDFKLDI